jgi:hypothetical protein
MKCFKKGIEIQQAKEPLLHPFQTNGYSCTNITIFYIYKLNTSVA